MDNIKLNILKLNAYLELNREVVGVKFLFDEKEFIESKGRALTNKMAYCTMVRNGMRGECIKAKLENFACLSAAKAIGLLETTHEDDSGKGRVKIGTYKNLCIGRSVSKDMVYCKHIIYGINIMPLKEFEVEPDVVIIVTEPYNMMRITQGYAYHNGQAKNIKLAGMQAICQECTSYPFETNDINVSMLCAGTRLLAQWENSELGVGMPYHMFNEIVNGIEMTINPTERNKNKAKIQARIIENGLEEYVQIIYNKNYDDGLYGGI